MKILPYMVVIVLIDQLAFDLQASGGCWLSTSESLGGQLSTPTRIAVSPFSMPAYHSQHESPLLVGNMGLLPLRTNIKGPAPRIDAEDIIDEALIYFKPNIFFREFEIKSPADRTLIYLTFYITECLRKLQRSANQTAGLKDLATLALSSQLPIPGEKDFPLNSMYKAPKDKQEEETMRAYLLQLRQELGCRLCHLVFAQDTNAKPSKWWLCFSRKRFMDKGLVSQGITL